MCICTEAPVPDQCMDYYCPQKAGVKRTRRVQFHDARVVGMVTPSSSMTFDERNDIWYQQSDLDTFKTSARDLSRLLRSNPKQMESNETRGLEHRISLERQKQKFLTTRAVLKAQERYQNADQLALIASKCSSWAKQVALVTATKDFCSAYDIAVVVPDVPPQPFPLNMRPRKRHSDPQINTAAIAEVQRCVKRRTSFEAAF
mmetsp:Transcript_21230/g.27932  ORF Transcript_21230/g.27932 Transcript_21230/m.27932 type:complete len:202 (-) Transcript_21230:110-715(-)|eukprot:CAMPEP_0195267986 /NCGR_PEP_ID=MMETSP0706-20130129/12908_1 /TAXON_ID=33640 /ORGANISM="Asterionellopsis glacialis, Strain CCMP134" /LENGTH=201 /DNA_ID=CAMNT_0040322825 /DNA_START=9 /DNA_END=614 /DNA_ORIENTATION=+